MSIRGEMLTWFHFTEEEQDPGCATISLGTVLSPLYERALPGALATKCTRMPFPVSCHASHSISPVRAIQSEAQMWRRTSQAWQIAMLSVSLCRHEKDYLQDCSKRPSGWFVTTSITLKVCYSRHIRRGQYSKLRLLTLNWYIYMT